MVCKKCGHALGTNNAVCPNCGTFMSREQLEERKSMNGANNPYMNRLYEINKKNEKNKYEERSYTKNMVGYSLFMLFCVILVALIIGLILLRK